MKIAFLFLCFINICCVSAQSSNKKALAAYNKAIERLQDYDLPTGIRWLKEAIAQDPHYMDAIYTLAGAYNETKKYDSSVSFYNKARSLDVKSFAYYELSYSVSLAGLGRFDEALKAVDRFMMIANLNDKSLKNAQYRKNCYAFALAYANKHPNDKYVFEPVNMGDSINSSYPEYYPSSTINDSIFVYTRRMEGVRENFMESIHKKDGTYSQAQIMGGEINDEPSKGAINISQDGDCIIFAGKFPGKGYGDFDLYISYSGPNGWSDPENLGANINTEYWESSPSLSPDKTALYFSSNRPSGLGGNDIYVSYLQPNGKWGKAINMGTGINTPGDELAPFIHADNQTLYFTSSGLLGYGGTDLFVTRKDSLGGWTKPENLGYPINTIDNEGSLFIASDGVTAYYASDRSDSRGGLDLYRFKLRSDIQPSKTAYITGRIRDKETHQGISTSVELTDNASRQVISKTVTDNSGNYFITLPVGRDYTITLNKKGYLFYSELYPLSNAKAKTTYRKDIEMQPIRINASLTLRNIQFAFNSYELEPVSLIELQKVLQLLLDNTTLKLRINGHTDNTGNESVNMPLSANRAKAVVDYLVKNGINASRLEWKGFGSSIPVADNNTDEGRALNRRTEIVVIGL